MTKSGFKHFFFSIILITLTSTDLSSQDPVIKFSLGGHTAYHISPGKINDMHVVYTTTYHGKVFCHDQSGNFLWSADAGEGFPFDLESIDLDSDGKDEALVASSDGSLYAFDDNGQPLWTFSREAPLYQVEALKENSEVHIFTGGIERKLFSLNPDGTVKQQLTLNGVVRLIGSGKIRGDANREISVTTTRSALGGNVSMYLLEPASLNQIWKTDLGYDANANQSGRFFCMEIFDIDNDGKEEMLLGHDHTQPNKFTLVDENGISVVKTTSVRPPTGAYKMNLYHHIKSSSIPEGFLVNHYGQKLIVMDLNGVISNQLSSRYAYTNSDFDSTTNTLFFSSEISGGDGIYGIKMDHPGWKSAFTNITAVGSMVKMEANLSMLEQQINDFVPPAYQAKVEPIEANFQDQYFLNLPDGFFENTRVSAYLNWTEDYDRSVLSPPWNTKTDPRKPYDMSFEEIISKARQREANGQDFFLWAGHGMDPFYLRLETLKEILKVAPTTLRALVFAELELTNDAMRYVVETHIKPLADLCLEQGNCKIFFRNKNVFWSGNIYLDLWMDLFGNEKYKDVFIAGLEETNCRSQSLSLYARMGLRLTDQLGEIGVRPVTDNGNFVRAWEWCHMQRMSHQVRAGAIARMLGANSFVQDIHTGTDEETLPFYLMMDKGILPLSKPENTISVSDIAVGIKIPPDHDYIESGTNGHNINGYAPGSPKMVFDRLDCYWGGALTPEWDFTYYAFNSKRRMTNFIAQAPYGNIAVVAENTDLEKYSRFKKLLITDGKNWFDENGVSHGPEEYKDYVIGQLEEAAGRLPIRVIGEISWSAVMIDSAHYRVVVIDPGYVDPADRQGTIKLQGIEADKAIDILSGEELTINNNEIEINIPMGILRVIDLIRYPYADAGEDIYINELPVDSVVLYGSGDNNGEPLTYKWKQVSGPDCDLIQTDSATLIVKNIKEGNYSFRLTVTDNEGDHDSDDVNLFATCVSCNTPEVDAGYDRSLRLPKDTIILNGTILFEGNGIHKLRWTILSGPEGILQSNETLTAVLSDMEPGTFIIGFTATSNAGYSNTDTVQIIVLEALPVPDTIFRNTQSIQIDGLKEESWCGTDFEIDSMIHGYFDTYSSASFLWDDTCLYVHIEIEDKFLMNDSGEDWWDDDAVEIFIDAENSKSSTYDENDFHFVFRLHNTEMMELIHNQVDNIEYELIQEGDRFFLEIAFPWSLLNTTPETGKLIGLEIRVRDDYDGLFYDAIEALFGYTIELTPKPDQYGILALGEACMEVSIMNNKFFSELVAYPNPTKSILRVSGLKEKKTSFILNDTWGRAMIQGELSKKDEIELSSLSKGIYFLSLSNGQETRTIKITKID
jgi:hypothetical protein